MIQVKPGTSRRNTEFGTYVDNTGRERLRTCRLAHTRYRPCIHPMQVVLDVAILHFLSKYRQVSDEEADYYAKLHTI